MRKIVLATNNKNKLREVREILTPLGITVLSQQEAGTSVNPEENGTTFAANAEIKARAVYEATGLPVIADDSGLCVDALDGAPGVYSARYSGENATDASNRAKLLQEMQGIKDRSARFHASLVLYFPNGEHIHAEGTTEGLILEEETGENGFGYDNLFFSLDLNMSFGLASAEAKNKISHRGRAILKLAETLKEIAK